MAACSSGDTPWSARMASTRRTAVASSTETVGAPASPLAGPAAWKKARSDRNMGMRCAPGRRAAALQRSGNGRSVPVVDHGDAAVHHGVGTVVVAFTHDHMAHGHVTAGGHPRGGDAPRFAGPPGPLMGRGGPG